MGSALQWRVMVEDDETGVRAEVIDRVAIWTLARPSRRHALTRAMLRRLGNLAREAHADRELCAVIVTGEGVDAFCAGADLKERKQMSLDEVREFLPLYQLTLGAIDRLDKPVIAAINGVALGGGLELALACDFRVAAAHAVLGLPETALGVIPGAGGTQRLPRLIGTAAAKRMIVFAERVSATEGLRLGLVDRVADQFPVLEEALRMADPLRRAAPIAIAAALDAIDAAAELPLDAGLEHERRCYERTLTSEDRVEALLAFAEKRAPRFRGQ